MYIVYSGYVTPDNYDTPPTHTVRITFDSREVVAWKKAHEECVARNKEARNSVFRVFEGIERTLEATATVVDYTLK